VAALERSLGEIVRRHEVLRTRFASVEGTPAQVIHEDLGVKLSVVDLGGMEDAKREGEARRLTQEEVRRPFDLSVGPLLRAMLLRLSEEDHVAVFTMHHIVSDAWSLGVLVREVVALYEAFSRGADSPLEELPVQYADYAEWQRDWLQGEVLENHLSYWKTQLGDAPAVLELPTDRPRPRIQTDNGAVAFCEFGTELAQRLKALSREEGVTLFMTLVAAFQVLLYRYSRQTRIVVGTPIANRRHAEIEGLIGFFTNTLVISTDLSGDPNFRELLGRVREVCLGAYAHQDVPFEMLVEELQPERSLSYTPLFQVMFTLQNAPSEALELKGLTVGSFGAEGRTAKFDLNLSLRETEQGLNGGFEYNTDLFDGETIDRMIGHLEALLSGIVTDPGRRISELPLLRAAEERQLLVEWNETRQAYPRQCCVQQLFEEQVAMRGEQTALVFGAERLSYRELNERANQLAHYLRSFGVGPEARVGIMMERSAEMLIAVLGVLKAGGAYVPLDPVYPRERISFMLADAGATVLLTHGSLADQIDVAKGSTEAGVRVVRLDEVRAELAGQRDDDPRVGVDGDNLAYVIYTSGSTGRPKGIGLSHRALSNLIEWHFTTLSAGVKTLQFASLSFDASFHEAFSALCSGGELLVLSEAERLDMAELARLLAVAQVEKAVLPVVVLQQLAEIYTEADEAEYDLAHLREAITTGEQLQITTPIRELFKRLRHCALHNHYGPSETHVVTYHLLGDDSDQWPSHPPIGRPIANTRIYLLDDNLRPVPVGVLGQVYIGGVMLARGYVNRPELTAEKFIPDPHSSERGARLYKTGDWGRYLPDGSVEFLGRIDHQVKIRGFRVELGEIEAVLSRHDAVRECVVIAREDDATGDKRLIAYLVAEPDSPPSLMELRGYTRQHLPDYMVPSQFVTLAALPLTPNGKVDRRALPAPDSSRAVLNAHSVAPRTAAEQVVASIFARVLGVEQVGVTDNFFELGGHSLLATRVMSRVGKVFQVGVALRQLFEWPTVEGVVAALGQQWGDSVVVEDIAQTFLEIEQLPDASVEVMLAQQELEAGEPTR
jgi:amino acid adenylation domain-containing protein